LAITVEGLGGESSAWLVLGPAGDRRMVFDIVNNIELARAAARGRALPQLGRRNYRRLSVIAAGMK
jgi:hypothetical protein